MSFHNWLLKQNKRNDAIGDLARDALQEIDLKESSSFFSPTGIRAWRKHLEQHSACDECVDALEKAWVEFRIAKQLRLDCK
jgi:hypothetical protein